MPRQLDQTGTQQASLAKRFAALIYDLLVLIGLLFCVSALWIVFNNGEAVSGPFYNTSLFLTIFLFNAYFWTRSGQTIGMMAWRLRVQTVDGYTLNWTQSLIRFFSSLFSIACFGAGYWTMLLNDERLTWHDRFSDTRVVVLPKRDTKKQRK